MYINVYDIEMKEKSELNLNLDCNKCKKLNNNSIKTKEIVKYYNTHGVPHGSILGPFKDTS